jgi:hypothetical protein
MSALTSLASILGARLRLSLGHALLILVSVFYFFMDCTTAASLLGAARRMPEAGEKR